MAEMNLPAHLQGRVPTGMVARAAEGMGSSLPPHLSIRGNAFTFIDATGNEAPPMLTFDGYIIDISDVMCKRYYDKVFDQNADVGEPPACWSSNGVAPSREAAKPQAISCEMCDHNRRGSKISAISGSSIKACRDEKWIAIINPNFGNMVFQLVITPGSFTNWKGFVKQLENYRVEPSWVLTRFSFEPKTNGVLQFTMVNWSAPEALAAIDAALAEKKTDAIVGRLDQPRTAALAPPTAGVTPLPPNQFSPPGGLGSLAGSALRGAGANYGALSPPSQQEVIPPGSPASTPFAAPPAGFPATPQGAQTTLPMSGETGIATGAAGFPSEPTVAAPQRRRRGAVAQPPPAQNGAAPPAGAPVAPFAPQPAPQAPFAPSAASFPPPSQPAMAGGASQPNNNFGIGGGGQVNNPEMTQMLANLFPNQGR